MELVKDQGLVAMRPSEDERIDLGRGIKVLAASYDESIQPIEVTVSIQIAGLKHPVEMHYLPGENRVRMDRGADWFLGEGGDLRRFRTFIQGWLAEARTRKADGAPRRARPSPIERAKHIQDR